MNVYPELKKIAGLNQRIRELHKKLVDKIDMDDLEIESAHLVSGCSVRNGQLWKNGGKITNCRMVDDDYYCDQHTGYCEDDYYGTLYFGTNVPGQYVAVPFHTY